jgi:FkbM family methyltransferase
VPPIDSTMHHPIFERFEYWRGFVPAHTQANWLGVLTDVRYAAWAAHPEGVLVGPPLPPVNNDEYAEWIDLLDAVCCAGERFAMVELGAGWGRWLANAAAAYRQLRPGGQLCLVGVEAEPTHFRWLGEHLERNGIGRQSVRLFEAAVAAQPGHVVFEIGDPTGCYGQHIASRATWRVRLRRRRDPATRIVRAITLAQALAPIDGIIDLIDLDVQGAEADVLEAGADELERVRCVHVGTHSVEQEDRLRALFGGLGWRCRNDYPWMGRAAETWWGARDIEFEDGVQTWLNPGLGADARFVR